jgi:transducin (beta)-like 1
MLKKYNAYLFPIFRSGDSSARIWTIVDGPSSSSAQNGSANVVVLKHFRGRTNEKSKDVTTLDWSVSV